MYSFDLLSASPAFLRVIASQLSALADLKEGGMPFADSLPTVTISTAPPVPAEAFQQNPTPPAPLVPSSAAAGLPPIAPVVPSVPPAVPPANIAPAPLPLAAPPAAVMPPSAAAAGQAPAGTAEVDLHGLPWDERIHSKSTGAISHPKNTDGSWRKRKGVSATVVSQVEAELKQAMVSRGAVAPAPVAVVPATVAPIAPVVPAAPAALIPPPPPIPQAPAAPATVRQLVATTKAHGRVPADFTAVGWTEERMVAEGYFEWADVPAPAATPAPTNAPHPSSQHLDFKPEPCTDFVSLLMLATSAQQAGILTLARTAEAVQAVGLADLQSLQHRTDLIPQVETQLRARFGMV